MTENPNVEIDLFLSEVEGTLDTFVDFFIRTNQFVKNENTSVLVLRSWKEVKPRFGLVKGKLLDLSLNYLEERGLSRTQLNMKLNIFHEIKNALYDAKFKYENFLKDEKHSINSIKRNLSKWWKKILTIFNNLCDVIDSLLKSLGIPFTDAIEEFKDTFKAWVNFSDIIL